MAKGISKVEEEDSASIGRTRSRRRPSRFEGFAVEYTVSRKKRTSVKDSQPNPCELGEISNRGDHFNDFASPRKEKTRASTGQSDSAKDEGFCVLDDSDSEGFSSSKKGSGTPARVRSPPARRTPIADVQRPGPTHPIVLIDVDSGEEDESSPPARGNQYYEEIKSAYGHESKNEGNRERNHTNRFHDVLGKRMMDCDGSCNTKNRNGGFGGLIRDNTGQWLIGFKGHLTNTSSLEAEIWAIYRGLTIILEKGWEEVEIYTDSKDAMQIMENGAPSNFSVPTIVEDARFILRNMKCNIKYLPREENQCADRLARMGKEDPEALTVWDEAPNEVRSLVVRDMINPAFRRQ